MPTFIALLRAVNVAGHGLVSMADLKELLGDLGFEEPRSLLASGNLVFRASRRTSSQLETHLTTEIKKRLGLTTDVFVRTAEDWRALIEANPFPKEAKCDPSHLLATFLADAPSAKQVAALQAAIRGREQVRAVGRQAYLVYPDGIGRSKLTSALIEKHLGTRGTGRNWNTVQRLAALATVPL